MRVVDKDTGEEFNLDSTEELSADLQEWHNAECTHGETQIRTRVVSNGGTHVWRQCQICGEFVGQAIGKSLAPATHPPADELLLARRRAGRRQQYDEIIQKHIRRQKSQGSEWWTKYNAYLQTPQWRAIATRVLKRANGICEGCGQAGATQVHHLTYQHVFNEFLFDLVAVCRACHERLHDETGPIPDEWREDFPCHSCRFHDEKDHRVWCGAFDVLAVRALAEGGECGPAHAGFEPLK